MSDALTIEAVVADGRIEMVDRDFYRTRAAAKAKQWGDGTVLKIRIEPVTAAIASGQRRYYFGQIIRPLAEWSGYPEMWWHELLKTVWLPDDGRQSIMELDHEEMGRYLEACEVYARTTHPEAFDGREPPPRDQDGA